jgi:predicted O-linked N-acetylglucosamine transferase (SPINDLY family)
MAVNVFEHAMQLHREGRLPEALARYDVVLLAEPRNAVALHHAGVASYQSGNLVQAQERIRRAVAIDPGLPDAWSNLGLVLQASGNHQAAVAMYENAARLEPDSVAFLGNLASALVATGRQAEAEVVARRLIALDGAFAKAWFVLALTLQGQGRILEALEAVTRAAGLAPDREEHAGLKAQIETRIGAGDQARRTLDQALGRHPMSAPLRFALACVLEQKLADVPAAIAAYDQVLRLEPRNGAALSQLVFLRASIADWRERDALVQRFRAGVEAGMPGLSPFAMLSLPSARREQRQCARAWTAMLASVEPMPRRRTLSARRLRIGYLSADFHQHATAYLAVGLFERHDRNRFQIFAYSTGAHDHSPMRARLERAFDRFVDLHHQDPMAIADAIRRDAIDILVDLKGHTEGATPIVLARRPAPIQVHYLGYPGTLGGGIVDYLVGDTIVTPADHADDYDEALAVLPESYQVNDRGRPIGATPSREAEGLPPGALVFCSFNQTYKINPAVFDAWMAILRAVPDSVLWLLARAGDDPAPDNLRREAQARGVAPSRLVFGGRRPNPEHLARYRQADLFLDTWPYNAHTTASDALWAGCPVLTIEGSTFAGRVAASLVHAAGLPELVAPSVDAYVERAIALAFDPAARARLRAHLEGPGRASVLFDTERTTRALEAAYETMATQFRKRERRSFRIQPAPPAGA